jgi:YjjG family noncanonical pyrimidine nucleotidase
MKTYEWVLFDADDTLFHFDSYAGLRLMFCKFGVEFTDADFQAYQAINKPLWVEYQNGAITLLELQHRRFQTWAEKLKCNPSELNSAFLAAMAEICAPMDGAISLLDALRGISKLGVITNGFVEIQERRFCRAGLRHYFDVLVISEQVGVAKPHREIFEYALSAMGNPRRDRVLMVGDNPHSDILGGINAGMDTCWFNADGKAVPEGISPKYQVSCLTHLEALLLARPACSRE